MSFFNKKEDVMKIELTPHGRSLLMEGKLKPQFYAFFDDDILYDSRAGGFDEHGTDAKTRILTNTPSLKPQSAFTGVESKVNNFDTTEDDNLFLSPIGTNKQTSKKANGWEVSALLGEFESSTPFISSSVSPLYNIPQIECLLNFTMSVGHLGVDKYVDSKHISSELAEDESFVKVTTETLLLHVLEKNGFSYKDSLSLEVYKYDPDEAYFSELRFNELTDIDLSMLDEEEINEEIVGGETGNESYTDSENAFETYFILERDREISNFDLCKGIKKLKEKNIYLGLKIDCEEEFDEEVNIYETLVTEIEDCDDV